MMETQQWQGSQQQSAATTGKDSTENGDQRNEDNIAISEKARRLITLILDQMKELSNAEKYLLFLKLFQISNVVDPLRQPLNPLGSRSEINRTISWIKTHLEEDVETSLPKQEVYEEYTVYCSQNEIKSLSQADFGKVMKQVYPKVRARRLGTRGNSRYCYSGLRRCLKLKSPKLPDLADKPLSTEAPCTQSSLTAAAWLIVKEWSEYHFKEQFPSLQALAKFLVVSHSIGIGTDAANQLTIATDSQLKGDIYKSGVKHKEMQLQLQKKIQQKNEVKERKRKIQSPKSEPKSSNTSSTKKAKSVPSTPVRLEDTSPILTGAGESSTSTSTGSTSTSTSPTQGKPVCDKTLEFTTQLPALPDFKSFQKPICEQLQNGTSTGTPAKVAIPRLALKGHRSPHSSPKKQVKNAKYKAIQPKPQQACDNASYNPQQLNVADIRSQPQNLDRFKLRSDEDCDPPVFPLPRERLDSISNVDKDAMDEYLGTNNSQHEEELSKYFSNNEPTDSENNTKISQLRQLLEQNGISDNKGFISEDSPTVSLTTPLLDPLTLQHNYATPNTIPINSQAKRRVSFETPFHEDVVPPSPNTRRKNFSFTPISPGPQSPNGRQSSSKCSSTNVSPFVSPSNTPVPRSKISSQLTTRKKIKREPGLTVDIGVVENKLAMSAPASPMLSSKSVLEKLLHSNSKVTYTPDYVTTIKPDVNEMLETYRSQSVPVNQMIENQFLTGSDFNDFDPISETVNVNRIIDALDEQQCDDIYNVGGIDGFNMNMDFPYTQRQLSRSQSIDLTNQNPPSRSVPSTPLSFNKPQPVKSFPNQSSRSYPSTPLLVGDATFNYNVNSDCLLNGQPIRNNRDQAADSLTFFMMPNETVNEDNNLVLPNSEFIVETENGLMDENGVLIGEQNYNN